MRLLWWLLAALFALAACNIQASQIPAPTAFVGARIIDGTGAPPLEDGVLLVRHGRIEDVGRRETVRIPPGSKRVEVSGKTIIPGLINTHGHVGDTRGLSTGHYTEENILRQLRLYARYGITTVLSLGGDRQEGVRIRDAQDTASLDRARLYVAGAVVTGDTPEEARRMVDENAAMGVDFIKIRVDDFLGRVPKMSPEVYRAVIERAHRHRLPVAVHLFYLEDARAVVRAGADFIAHSVRDRAVDDTLITLLKTHGVSYCPTLTREVSTFVYADEPDFFSDPFFLKEVAPDVLEQLRAPERRRRVRDNPDTERYRAALEVALANLKTLADAGVTIAFGTDSGPPGRFQGYFEHMEAVLMAEAGLTPEQILLAATRDAARALRNDEIGTLEPGKWADFIVLDADPLEDIRHLRRIESVWIAGNRVPEER